MIIIFRFFPYSRTYREFSFPATPTAPLLLPFSRYEFRTRSLRGSRRGGVFVVALGVGHAGVVGLLAARECRGKVLVDIHPENDVELLLPAAVGHDIQETALQSDAQIGRLATGPLLLLVAVRIQHEEA